MRVHTFIETSVCAYKCITISNETSCSYKSCQRKWLSDWMNIKIWARQWFTTTWNVTYKYLQLKLWYYKRLCACSVLQRNYNSVFTSSRLKKIYYISWSSTFLYVHCSVIDSIIISIIVTVFTFVQVIDVYWNVYWNWKLSLTLELQCYAESINGSLNLLDSFVVTGKRIQPGQDFLVSEVCASSKIRVWWDRKLQWKYLLKFSVANGDHEKLAYFCLLSALAVSISTTFNRPWVYLSFCSYRGQIKWTDLRGFLYLLFEGNE